MQQETEKLINSLLAYVDGSELPEEYQKAVDYSHSFFAKLENFLPLKSEKYESVLHSEARYFLTFLDGCRELLEQTEYLRTFEFTFSEQNNDNARAEKIANAIKAALDLDGEHEGFKDAHSNLKMSLSRLPDDINSLEKTLSKTHDVVTARFESCKKMFIEFRERYQNMISRVEEYSKTLGIGGIVPMGSQRCQVREIMSGMPETNAPSNAKISEIQHG